MPGTQKRLGRGLDDLLPQVVPKDGDVVRVVGITELDANPDQPRRGMDVARLEELAASIRTHGVLEPLIVRPVAGRYQVVAGERRLRAAMLVGVEEVPVVVREFSDAEVVEVALIENLQREELNALEEAEGFRRLVEEFGLTQEELSNRLGRSRSSVANSLRLLQLGERARAALAQGVLSAGHARALLAVTDPAVQARLVERVIADGLSVRETERLVQGGRRAEARPAGRREARAAGAEWRAVEERLREVLGTRVRVRTQGNGVGWLEIEFFGADDLERLTELIGCH